MTSVTSVPVPLRCPGDAITKKNNQTKRKQAFRWSSSTVAHYIARASSSPTFLCNLLPLNQYSACCSYQTSLKFRIHGRGKYFKTHARDR